MERILFGPGPESLPAEFDSAGVKYERWVPRPWPIMIAGFWARQDGEIGWPEVSKGFVAWVAARSSRKISVTGADHKLLDREGLNVQEVEKALAAGKNKMMVDRQSRISAATPLE